MRRYNLAAIHQCKKTGKEISGFYGQGLELFCRRA
jgi:hypothetical protein